MKIASYSFLGDWVKIVRKKEEYETEFTTIRIRKTHIVTYSNCELIKSYVEQFPPFERKHEGYGYRAKMTLRGGKEFHIDFDSQVRFVDFVRDMDEGLRC